MNIDTTLGYISAFTLTVMFTYFVATYDFNQVLESIEIFKAAL